LLQAATNLHKRKEGECGKHLLKSIDQRDDVVALETDVALGAEGVGDWARRTPFA
jgi:hypothetical protein